MEIKVRILDAQCSNIKITAAFKRAHFDKDIRIEEDQIESLGKSIDEVNIFLFYLIKLFCHDF
jgi:hypothetical protein